MYNNNRLLGIVNKFCMVFGTEIKKSLSLCGGGLDSDGTVVTPTELQISSLCTLIRILNRSREVKYY